MIRRDKGKPHGNDDEVMVPQQSAVVISVDQKTTYNYTARIDGYLEEPADFRGLLAVLDNMGEEDTMVLRLSTGGGDLEIALTIRNALKACRGTTVLVLDTWAASAGTMWFNVVDQVAVQPHAYIMVHGASYGLKGHMSHIAGNVVFSEHRVRALFHDIYEGFMTKDEIEHILNTNQDVYMDEEEICKRLKMMNDHFETKNRPAAVPKPKAARPKKGVTKNAEPQDQ